MKPLYIQGNIGTAVDYDEPALTVSAQDKTRQLFPLTRVSRVVVTGRVDWTMPALFACADAGVAVVFLHDNGEVRSRWLGCVRNRQNLLQLFVDFWQRADALEHYGNWLAGMERMAVRSCARRLGFIDWQDADAAGLKAWLNRFQEEGWQGLDRLLSGFLLAQVLNGLSDAGLDARSDFLHDDRINFAGDISALLLWDFYPALLAWRRKSASPPDHRTLAGFYEGRTQRTENLLRGLLNKWHQCILGLS